MIRSNRKIEAELIRKAIDNGFEQLVIDNPYLHDISPTELAALKNTYGWGFVAGIQHAEDRVKKLSCSA